MPPLSACFFIGEWTERQAPGRPSWISGHTCGGGGPAAVPQLGLRRGAAGAHGPAEALLRGAPGNQEKKARSFLGSEGVADVCFCFPRWSP